MISRLVAGCDEVGRGCLAGPLVAGVVILPTSYRKVVIKDSKALSSKQRRELSEFIKEEALDWAIGFVSVEEIDQYNVLQASHLAMHRAIARLHLQPSLLLVDGKYFNPYPSIPHQCIVKGDTLVSAIAAASVIAKVYRDSYMQSLAREVPCYGWERNMGYPTLDHRKAIVELGITSHHRKTFSQVACQLQPTLWPA